MSEMPVSPGRTSRRVPGWVTALWWPTPRSAQRLAATVAVVLGLVVLTGAGVRLSGSGLGCPTWPTCTATSVHSGLNVHGLIEFGNRVLSAVIFLTAIVALAVVVTRARRADLRPHIIGLFGGYLAEAVLGGFTVLTRLNPLLVATHFLLALGLLWLAIVVWKRLGERPMPPVQLVSLEIRWLTRVLVATTGLVLVLGTLVTGTGPHAGSRVNNRLPFNRRDITQIHSDAALLLIGALAVTVLLLRIQGAPGVVQRRARLVLVLVLGQATVGFIQYATGLPAWLVGIHVAGATAIWAGGLLLLLSLEQRPAETSFRQRLDPVRLRDSHVTRLDPVLFSPSESGTA